MAAWSLVYAAAFHSDKAIFDNVHPTDTMFAAKRIQRLHHAEWRQRHAVQCDAIAGIERKIDVFRFVGRVLWRGT